MSTTLPNLPALSASPAHTLTDADIVHVNHSASPGVGGDRKATLAELRPRMLNDAYLENVNTPASQMIVETASWNGVTGIAAACVCKAAALQKDVLGRYTFDALVQLPSNPTTWTADDGAVLYFTAGSGVGTPHWDAFLAQLTSELVPVGGAEAIAMSVPATVSVSPGDGGTYPTSANYPGVIMVDPRRAADTMDVYFIGAKGNLHWKDLMCYGSGSANGAVQLSIKTWNIA